MSDGSGSHVEQVLLYRLICRAWERAIRLEDPLLSYLLGMAVVHLWEQLGAGLRLPSGLTATRPPDPTC